MKKTTLTIAIAGVALAGMLFAGVTSASATPNKSVACTGCHSRSIAVVVTATKVTSTAKLVTYRVKVRGGSGTTAYVVFNDSKVIARRTSSTGTFKVAPGKKVKIWAVSYNTGCNYKSLTAKR